MTNSVKKIAGVQSRVLATGGNITTSVNKTIHTFTTVGSDTLIINHTGIVSVLVVAGGGGGASGGGGGGAGGLIYNAAFSVTPQTYTVTVGGGGTGRTLGSFGDTGQDSVFSSITAKGGGGGNHNDTAVSPIGGSGGGGGSTSTVDSIGGIATPTGQGNNGGSALHKGAPYASGGGGGAGVVGGATTADGVCGNGGLGIFNYISGSVKEYAGGGGGSNYNAGGTQGTAFSGGGGAAGDNGTAGTANTGGGGGGARNSGTGGNGGSGIVIVSYENNKIKKVGKVSNISPELLSTALYNDAVLYYRLEANSTDAKGLSNGTDTNITYGTQYGKFGQGAYFNGTSAKIDLNTKLATYVNNFTYSCWIKPNATQANAYNYPFGAQEDATTGFSVQQSGSNANLMYACWGNAGWHVGSNFQLDSSYWQHLVVTKSSTDGCKVYINTVLVSTFADNTAITPPVTMNVRLGECYADTRFWGGSIDDFAFFGKVLSAAEISTLYNGSVKKIAGVSNI